MHYWLAKLRKGSWLERFWGVPSVNEYGASKFNFRQWCVDYVVCPQHRLTSHFAEAGAATANIQHWIHNWVGPLLLKQISTDINFYQMVDEKCLESLTNKFSCPTSCSFFFVIFQDPGHAKIDQFQFLIPRRITTNTQNIFRLFQ